MTDASSSSNCPSVSLEAATWLQVTEDAARVDMAVVEIWVLGGRPCRGGRSSDARQLVRVKGVELVGATMADGKTCMVSHEPGMDSTC